MRATDTGAVDRRPPSRGPGEVALDRTGEGSPGEGVDRAAAIDALTEIERHRILVTWNDTARAFPGDRCLHELVRETIARTPGAVAGTAGGEGLTYGELGARATRLAEELRRLGVRPRDRVGLAMGRRIDLLVALLGILDAGATWVPLDPGYPTSRLAYMIEDAGLSVIVTEAAAAGELPRSEAIRVVLVDAQGEGAAPGSGDPRPASPAPTSGDRAPQGAPSDPDDVAYVIYTSGSTGRPKGVETSHRAVVNLAWEIGRLLDLGPADRVLQYASISFDTSVEEIFPALLRGATVVMRPEILPGTRELVSWIGARGISILDLPTAFWHEWVKGLRETGEPLPSCLRAVIIGGERATGSAVAIWRAIARDGCRLINTYGPTEATVTATVFEVGPEVEGDPAIGRPLGNVCVYVLDAELQPVPVDMPGELFIGGAGVARGYLGQPELTAERFMPNPLGVGGDRAPILYRTGDRVAWSPDGQLRFLGRLDDQVKLHGYRIELGEVQAVLEASPSVFEAVVTVARREGSSGPDALVAHVVPAPGARPDGAALRAWLADQLPPWMVPSAVFVTPHLPRTPNGKVDRRALGEGHGALAERRSRALVAPRSHVEELLARVWAEVLEIPSVGVTESFFDLGGHSLLAMRLIDRAHHAGIGIRLEDIVQHPTIAGLATQVRLDALDDGSGDRTLVALRPGGSRPPLFLLHSTPGDLFGYLDLVRALGPDQPCFGLQSLGLTHPARAHRSLEAMAAHYAERLRQAFPGGPYHLLGWCFGGVVAFEVARQLRRAGCAVPLVAMIDAWPRPPGELLPAWWAARTRSVLRELRRGGLGFLRERVDARLRRRPPYADDALAFSASSGPLQHRAVVHALNMEAIAAYRTGPLDGRIAVFVSEEQEAGEVPDEHLCWEPLVREARFHVVAGSHTEVLREPSATALARLLRAEVDALPGA